jgi:hypothetical protein
MPVEYSGPFTSPTFVAGVINDAWDKAESLVASARVAAADLPTNTISVADLDTLTVTPTLAESLPSLPAADTIPEFEDALTALLADWIEEHFPDTDNPDAAAAWARIVATFTGSEQTDAVADATAHVSSVTTGYETDIRETIASVFSADSTRATAGATRNRTMIDYQHRKAIDLSQLDLVMRTQLEALDAARGFLIEAIFGLGTKGAQELERIANSKRRLQDAYFSHLSARVEESSIELDRLALAKKIEANADVEGQARDTFIFRENVKAALSHLESLAHQAQGAINRASASASVGGGESSP